MQVSSQSWCLWLTHRVNCWQDSQERRWVCLRRKLNCEYRRCHLRSHVESISLDHRTFKHPRISDAASETRLSELEEFWDSEMARIDKEGAKDWGEWYASGKRGISASCGVELAQRGFVQLDLYCQWSFHETQRDHLSLLPAKSSDQATDIDPFTTVLFSDVRLFEMRYLAARLAFRLAWLSFLGLHVPGLSQRMLHRTGMIGGVLVI